MLATSRLYKTSIINMSRSNYGTMMQKKLNGFLNSHQILPERPPKNSQTKNCVTQ